MVCVLPGYLLEAHLFRKKKKIKYSWGTNWWKYWTILLVYIPQNQRCRKATYCTIWPIWIFEQITKCFNPSLLMS